MFGLSIPWIVQNYSLVYLGTTQSLKKQFLKAVVVDVVHIIAPYVKIATCIHSLCHLQNYLQMQNETTDCLILFE